MKKRAVLFLMCILLASTVIAVWNVDVNNDGCIDQDDLDLVNAKVGVRGTSDYDVTGNMIVDHEDVTIIQTYIDRGYNADGCDGFLCKPELCNGEDDDCDGNVDEDKGMCDEGHVCMDGECVFNAGDCYDSDGYNIYVKGKAVGITSDGLLTEGEESCYKKDIYNKLKKATECYGDSCFMMEYSCSDSDNLIQEYVTCKDGCRYGKCRNITRICHEEDHGLDIFRKSDGWFKGSNGTIWLNEHCEDLDGDGADETLVEYECLENFDTSTKTLVENYKKYDITCACSSGRCTNVAEGSCSDTDGNNKFIRGYTYSRLANGTETHNFDICMIKTGSSLAEADSCAGEDCNVKEYSCDYRGRLVEYIHDCSLGCVDGICTGQKCSSDEFFVTNDGSCLNYDDDCEYAPSKDCKELDKPSSRFNNQKDFACCSGSSEAYCVYNNRCYPSSRNSNYYNFSGEIVACGCIDSSCNFEGGNHHGQWYDLDSSQDLCEGGAGKCNMKWYPKTGFRWIMPGETRAQQENIWEYEDKNAECCGDDTGEFVACDGSSCICCDSKDDVYDNGVCRTAEAEGKEQALAENARPDEAANNTQKVQYHNPVPDEIPTAESIKNRPEHLKAIVLISIVIVLTGAIVLFVISSKRKSKEQNSKNEKSDLD